MNPLTAAQAIGKLLQGLQYPYQESIMGPTFRILTYEMPHGLPEIQMAFDFTGNSVDVLVFPHPHIANEGNYDSLCVAVNRINRLEKGIGHLYLDENFDIAYCLRIPYSLIEKLPNFVRSEIEFSIALYYDHLETLYLLSCDEISCEEAIQRIDDRWLMES